MDMSLLHRGIPSMNSQATKPSKGCKSFCPIQTFPVSGFHDILPFPGRYPHVRFRIASDSLPASVEKHQDYKILTLKPVSTMNFSLEAFRNHAYTHVARALEPKPYLNPEKPTFSGFIKRIITRSPKKVGSSGLR